MKRNKFSKALKHLKSKKIDEKLKLLDETPTNSMSGVYQVTPDTGDGFRMGIGDPDKKFYPKADGTWPSGIPANASDTVYIRKGGYYDSGKGTVPTNQTPVSRDFSYDDVTANGTSNTNTLIRPSDGKPYTALPEGTESFILGPLVGNYAVNHGYDDFTNIGYIQKDTRQFVLLATIQGFFKGEDRNSGNARTFDGTASQFTSYNSNFKLEHALWMLDRYNKSDFADNFPFNFSGGVPVERHPDNNSMGMGVIMGTENAKFGGNSDNIGTSQDPADVNDINSLKLMGLNVNPRDIYDPTTSAQKGRLGLNILRAFTDSALFGGSDYIFKGLSKGVDYLPSFTGASNLTLFGQKIPKIADWNPLFKTMAGKNYASQYFTPDLGTALKYGGEGGSIVALPRTSGVKGWKNWFGSNVSRGFDPTKGVEQLVRTSDTLALKGATKIFNTGDKASMDALTKLATKGAKTSRILKTAGRMVPFANLGLTVTDVSMRLSQGDYAGALLGAFSGIPGPVGWLSLGGQVAYDELGGKETMNTYWGPKLTAIADANKAANQSVSSSADRRAARGGGDRNEYGQNVKVSNSPPPKPSGNLETSKIDLEISNIELRLAADAANNVNRPQYEINRDKAALTRAKSRLNKEYKKIDSDHEEKVQDWEARRDARGSSYKPPRSIYQGAFKGLGNDATPSTPDPDPAPPKFEPEPQGGFGGGQGNPTNPRGSGAKPRPKPDPKPSSKPKEPKYKTNRKKNRPRGQFNDFTLNGNLLSEEKEGNVNFDGMGKAMIEMGLPEKKEDFVKEMGVLYTLQGEVNPQILSMILMAIAGEELSDEQKKWLDSNLVPFIGGYANKVEKEQGGEEVKESIITDESKKRILREVTQPLKEIKELPKTTKLKGYKPNFKGKFSPQNTPDVTASNKSDEIVSGKNASRQIWTAKDKYWKGYETTERMNIVYDRVGHGSQYFDRVVAGNILDKKKREKNVQEHLNVLAHEKALREVYGITESPFRKIEESETYDNKVKDPLFSKVANRLKKEIDYPKKPSPKGYPDEAPPKIDPNTGMHPKFGKRYKYDKLDPQSAEGMPMQGDPEIDANIQKATDSKRKARKIKNLLGK